MSETIYNSDYINCFPQPLKQDKKMAALAKSTANELLSISGEVKNVLIYSRIDELSEELLDILAYDFHVDWYDYSYPLTVKRDILKNSVRVHKKMGTKYAVENVLHSLYPQSRIEEWFEYGGEHHHFRVILNMDNSKQEIDINKIVKNINMYKRLSAHLESIILERRGRRKIYIMPVREIFVRRKVKINSYNKKVEKRMNMMIGSTMLIYTSIILHKKGDRYGRDSNN